jgi:predicted small lipoprotein YifL
VRRTILALMVALLAAAAAACSQDQPVTQEPAGKPAANAAQPSDLPQRGEPVRLDPGQFTTRIDNRWWPMTPGSRWVYRETDGEGSIQRVQVTVTDQTKTITGIQARVVHDVVTEDGQLVENTYDWYAQDDQGNIWYLGEDTKEYENGKVVSTEGSWEAGVDGAQPGILLPADPKRDLAYRQEYYKGQAEDAARVLRLDMRARVAGGTFDQLLTTQDSTPLEPNLLEHKFYAPGVGPVLAITLKGGSSREELVRFKLAP